MAQAAEFKFDFGSADTPAGFTRVAPDAAYDASRGFGYLDGAAAAPAKPAIFAIDIPEGNYDVTIRFGDASKATSTTIKAESRRLMLERVDTEPGKFQTRTFTVNVRRPTISTGGAVALKDNEKGVPNWDDRLTLEINGNQPRVASIEIAPARDAITVYLAGDSTVTDQPREPWGGWGQALPRFFDRGVAVSNHAWSGLALFSFRSQQRLDKILSTMKPGDYLFLQFGHNDQKDKSEGAGPFTSYKQDLKQFVAATREKGGNPVVVTPMERRRWKDGQPQETLTDFAAAVRQVAQEDNVPLIDLHAMSLRLYAALGEEDSKKAFVFYPANTFPGQTEELKDNSHHNIYGGYELARCIVEGIKTNVPNLAKHLTQDAGVFDPTKPDAPDTIQIPLSPSPNPIEKPAGN